jgi:hypothetical protein
LAFLSARSQMYSVLRICTSMVCASTGHYGVVTSCLSRKKRYQWVLSTGHSIDPWLRSEVHQLLILALERILGYEVQRRPLIQVPMEEEHARGQGERDRQGGGTSPMRGTRSFLRIYSYSVLRTRNRVLIRAWAT